MGNIEQIAITKGQKGWTRYGGARNGYSVRNINEIWYCQACHAQQPASFPPYIFPFDELDVLRICLVCQNKVLNDNITNFEQLLSLIRLPEEQEDTILLIIANIDH